MDKTPIYLDHNASTPMDPEVLETVIQVMRDFYANPSSVEHGAGSAAARIVESAREQVAQTLDCRPREIVFTSGSTEANNLAILGLFPELLRSGRTHVITSQIEHPSVLACFEQLEKRGTTVTRIGVNEEGEIRFDELREAMSDNTGLVSIMAANNETGVLQPIAKIGTLCEEYGALFHTDYSQASAYVSVSLKNEPIHMASFSGHKAYGPKGVGALYRSLRKPHVRLEPVLRGGGQENQLRSGTLNTPGIAGLGEAFCIVRDRLPHDHKFLSGMRDQLQAHLNQMQGVHINGALADRLPNSLSVSIDNIEPLALMHATKESLVFSASSACTTGKVETSHVLKAMFGDQPRAREAFRLGLGRSNSTADISSAAKILVQAVGRLGGQRI